MKALDRKVWLPSGGSLVIDRTEAMTVIDVNTGKFIGSGGNLEETVTRNNLEAAEEIVRQLRLRDIGGIVVIDFIDMVLESNRDLVLRRLTECLGRDRTKHQVAEVTSLGLVQMTRKRIGEGLLEAFSETVRDLPRPRRDPAQPSRSTAVRRPRPTPATTRSPSQGGGAAAAARSGRQARRGRGDGRMTEEQRKAALAAMAAVHRAAHPDDEARLDEEIAERRPDSDRRSPRPTDAAAELEMEAVASVIESADHRPGATRRTRPSGGDRRAEAEPEEPVVDPATGCASRDELPSRGRGAPTEAAAERRRRGAPSGAPRRRRRAATRPAGPPVAASRSVVRRGVTARRAGRFASARPRAVT